MSSTMPFETAAQTGFYDRTDLPPVDMACAEYLETLAKIIPHNPAENIVPETLRAVAVKADSLPSMDVLGDLFGWALGDLVDKAKAATYLDGNSNVCLAMDTHSKLLDAFAEFHEVQNNLLLNEAGTKFFADRTRARQIYWDMGGNVAPVSYTPNFK